MPTRLLLLIAVWSVAAGCARHCVPEPLTRPGAVVDLCAAEEYAPTDPAAVRAVAAEFTRRGHTAYPPGTRPYQFLALSGGGLFGSFGVGVLAGWTESGTRPQFDVVTGISTGAMIATFAFLGPEYDDVLRKEAVGLTARDIIRRRSVLVIPFADAVFNARPLERSIERVIKPELLAEVAKAHAAGRRLYVGTTSLDARRLVIWDMGAIAARGTPEAVELYRQIILASGSIPGAFPPVRIPVEIDGCCYEELHVDGGVCDEVLFQPFMVAERNRAAGVSGAQAPPGSTLYVVNNGKMYVDPTCVRTNLIPQLSAAARTTFYAKARDELFRIYLVCLESGVAFRTTAVPQELEVGTDALGLDRADQERLYEVGRGIGHVTPAGAAWRDLPPGTEPSEQTLPRSGTKFRSR